MQCSTCTQIVRPFMAFDIDGTMAEYHQHFTRFALDYWDLEDPLGKWPWYGEGEFEAWIGISKEKYREAKLAYRQGGMKRTMPPIRGTIELFKEMQAEGVEVWIATSRPWQLLNNIDPDTMEWLRRHGLKPDGIIYGDDKYEELVKGIDPARIVCVIDDLAWQLQKAASLGLQGVQCWGTSNTHFSQRWSPGGYPSGDADFAPSELLSAWVRGYLAEWRKRHADN